jgi:hypothetical protein
MIAIVVSYEYFAIHTDTAKCVISNLSVHTLTAKL